MYNQKHINTRICQSECQGMIVSLASVCVKKYNLHLPLRRFDFSAVLRLSNMDTNYQLQVSPFQIIDFVGHQLRKHGLLCISRCVSHCSHCFSVS